MYLAFFWKFRLVRNRFTSYQRFVDRNFGTEIGKNKEMNYSFVKPNLLDQYHQCCRVIKNNNVDKIPVYIISNLPRLSLITNMENNFMDEILSDWYLAFEKNIPIILPSQLSEITTKLIKMNMETNGDLLNKFTIERTMKIIDLSLKNAPNEKQYYTTVKQLVGLLSNNADKEQFVSELKKKLLQSFESIISSNIVTRPIVVGGLLYKLTKGGVSSPSVECLENISRMVLPVISQHRSMIALKKVKRINQTINAYMTWNIDPGVHYEHFWSLFFASACHHHQVATGFIFDRLSEISDKYEIRVDLQQLNQITLLKGDLWNNRMQPVVPVSKGDRNKSYIQQQGNWKDNMNIDIVEAINLAKKLNANVDMDPLKFFSLPEMFRTLHMEQYFVDNVAANWCKKLIASYDANWIEYIVVCQGQLSLINQETRGSLFLKLIRCNFFEYLSNILITSNNENHKNRKTIKILSVFISLNMNIFGKNLKNELIKRNVLKFWEKFYIDLDINTMSLLDCSKCFDAFSILASAGFDRPSDECLTKVINIFFDHHFVETKYKNMTFLNLKSLLNFSKALYIWNVNPDLYRHRFWWNNIQTILSLHQNLSASLSAEWMHAALKYSQVKEFMIYKPYWSKILNENLLTKSKIDQLIEEKQLWKNRDKIVH